MKVKANGKTFTFPEGTSREDIADAVDNYFASNPIEEQSQPTQPEEAPAPAPSYEVPSMLQRPGMAPQSPTPAPVEQSAEVRPVQRKAPVIAGARGFGAGRAISEYDDPQFAVDEDKSWEQNLGSEGFKNLPPVDKRQVADAYFDKHFAPSIPMEELEAERRRFHTSSGLAPLVNQEGEAKEARGLTDKAMEYWDSNTGEEIRSDIANLPRKFGESWDKFTQYVDDRGVLGVGKDIATGLGDMASDIASFGEEMVLGLPDDEFMRRYGVSKAEYTEGVGNVERFQIKERMDELDRVNIDRALRGEGPAEEVDVAQLRTEANQKASDVVTEGAIDVATMIPFLSPLKGARVANAATKLGSSATGASRAQSAVDTALDVASLGSRNVARKLDDAGWTRAAKVADLAGDSAVVGGGEVLKNIYQGRPLEENVLSSMALNTAVGAPFTARKTLNQATEAVDSVQAGKADFDKMMSDAGKVEKLETRKADILEGRHIPGKSAFESVKEVDPTVARDLNRAANIFHDKADVKRGTDILNDNFKKDMPKRHFVSSVNGILTMKRMKGKWNKEGIEAFYDLKQGKFDEALDLTKGTFRTKANAMFDGASDMDNYIRALEFEGMGSLGRFATDVAETKGLNKAQNISNKVADFASFGLGPWLRNEARMSSQKGLVKEAKDTMADALAQSRDELLFNREYTDTLKRARSESEFSVKVDPDGTVRSTSSDPSLQRIIDGLQAQGKQMYPDRVAGDRIQMRSHATSTVQKAIDDALSRNKILEEPTMRSNMSQLEKLEGLDTLSPKQLMDVSNSTYSYSFPRSRETLADASQDYTRKNVAPDDSKTAKMSEALAILRRNEKDMNFKSPMKNIAASMFLTWISGGSTAVAQATIQIANSMIQARQKRGLSKAAGVLKKHYSPLNKAKKAFEKESGLKFDQKFELAKWREAYALVEDKPLSEIMDSAKFKAAEEKVTKAHMDLVNATEAYNADVKKIGEGKVREYLGYLEKATRAMERFDEDEEGLE